MPKKKTKKPVSALLENLNNEQIAAVTHCGGPLMIIAGAGTGKTTVITKRIAWIIEQGIVAPENILALTFTEKAATEMEERVDLLLPYGYVDLQVSTFHSFCEKILRDYGVDIGLSRDFKLTSELDAWLLARANFDRFELDYYRPLGNPTKYLRSLLGHFSRVKDEMVSPDDYIAYAEGERANLDAKNSDDEATSEVNRLAELATAYHTYQQILAENDSLDFGDLILFTLHLFKKRPQVLKKLREKYKFILVDEFQDTNWAQYELIKLLAAPDNNLTVVGDDDQCLPGDAKISLPIGEKMISDIKVGDSVITAVGKGYLGVSSVKKVFCREKKAKFISFETKNGSKVTVTDNHKMFCRVSPVSDKKHFYVYLMFRKDLGWRMGTTNNLSIRLRLERSADKILALRSFETDKEARFYETFWSLKYGIPTCCFKERSNIIFDNETFKKLNELLLPEIRVRRLADDLNIDLSCHHYCLDGVNRGRSLRIKIHLEMCARKFRLKKTCQSRDGLLKKPLIQHILTINTSDLKIVEKIKTAGFSVSKSKKGFRLRITSQNILELGQTAEKLQKITEGIIEYKFNLGKSISQHLPALVMPAKNILPGLLIPIKEKNEIVYDQVISVRTAEKKAKVYDLEIDRTHNFLANNVVVHNSVYKFRGASLANILQFETDYPNPARVILTKNYRSGQKILDHAYEFIQKNNPNRLEGRVDKESKPFDKRLISQVALTGHVEHLHYSTLSEEARGVAEKILLLKEKHPEADWKDFGVLIRANSAADEFVAVFERYRIPYQFMALRGLYVKPVILDLIAILETVDNPYQGPSIYRLLSHEIFKISPHDLSTLTHYAKRKGQMLYEACRQAKLIEDLSPEAVTTIDCLLSLISKLAESAKQRTASELVVMTSKESKLLEHLNRLPEAKKQEDFRFLHQFHERVKKFEARQAEKKLHNFLEEFKHERDAGEEGSLNFDVEAGPDLVKIMTIHGSKGLEFRFVFIVNLVDRKFPTAERRDPIELPSVFIKEKLPEGDLHLEEERRLFYVAMTRAKDALFFTSAEDYGGARKRKLSRFLNELGIDKPEIISAEAVGPFVENDLPEAEAVPTPYHIPKQLSFTQLCAFESCPLQYKFAHILEIPVFESWSQSFGKTMHNTLQAFFELWIERSGSHQTSLLPEIEEKKDRLPVSLDELLKFYEEKWIDDWYQNEKQKKEYFEKGKESLKQYFILLKTDRPKPKALEQGFTLKVGDVAIKGRIDRLDDVDGGIEIIDYKSGKPKLKLEKGDRKQLLIYQLAVEEVLKLKPAKLTYHYLNDHSEQSFIGSSEDLMELKETILDEYAKMKSSNFEATPGFHCQFCDFKDICEFRRAE